MTRATVLAKAVPGHDSLLRKAGLVLGGSFLIAIAAQVSVPFFPVPMTLSTLAVLLVGLTLGSRLGAAAVLAYLAEGAMGLPVFAGRHEQPRRWWGRPRDSSTAMSAWRGLPGWRWKRGLPAGSFRPRCAASGCRRCCTCRGWHGRRR